ncbi:MAG: hypothetical protein JJ866_22835 [Roseibium sp.]|uniref:hypothetical protein n=1 Tax=Roseibium sp. TaxID=1936156 RepID=UPI001B00ECB7|nr:hypothetical protein [Roseibium sp.]MBO6894795.1 hypothetical protein [Roseibium sp.]MBO6929398.1 hypothetical protein [Roseibium sp.]
MFRSIVFAFALVFVLPLTAAAGPIQDKAASAEAALQQGEGSKAIALLREAVEQAWKEAPISVQKALFVSAPADGFGIYNARADNVFPAGEALVVYLEPVGFDWKQQDGLFMSLLTVDFDLASPDGKVLAGQKGFGKFDFKSHVANTEYMANLTLNISGAPAADYLLVLTVNDELGGGSTKVSLPFSIK